MQPKANRDFVAHVQMALSVLCIMLVVVSQLGPGGHVAALAEPPSTELEGGVRQDTLEGSVSHDEQGRGVVGMRFTQFLNRPDLGEHSTKQFIVMALVKDGPAYLAGIKKGDRIVQVDGKETSRLPRNEIARRIMGIPGTVVNLRVLRGHEQLVFAISRVDLDVLADPQFKEQLLRQEQASSRQKLLIEAGQVAALGGVSRASDEPETEVVESQTDREKAVDECNEASRLVGEMDYSAAARRLKQAVRIDPSFVEARHFYGVVLDRLGKTSEAADQLRECVQLKPELAMAWHALGSTEARQGRLAPAVDAFKQYIKTSPHCEDEAEIRSTISALEAEMARSPVRVSPDSEDYLVETTQKVRARWSRKHMPLRVYISDGASVSGFKPEFDAMLRQAFADWAAGSEGTVTFTYVDKPKSADITCSWTDDPRKLRFISEGGEANVTWRGSEILRSRILLLTVRGLQKLPLSNDFLRMVALHEIGHALGLQGHSSNPKDIMFMSGNSNGSLSDRDRKTLVALYKANLPREFFDLPRVHFSYIETATSAKESAPPAVDQIDAVTTAQWANATWADLMSAAALYASKGRRVSARQLFSLALQAAQREPAPDKQREMFTYEGLADLAKRTDSSGDAETYLRSAIACDPTGQRKELRKKLVSVCKELNKAPETEIQVAGRHSQLFYSSTDYDKYAAAVSRSCSKAWKPPYAIDPLPLTVVFWIEPNGITREIFIQQSSGHGKLDQSLVQAVLKQRQFPKVPDGAPERMFMQIHWAPKGMSEEQKALRGQMWGF